METEAKPASNGTGTIARLFPKFGFVNLDQKLYGSNAFMPSDASGVEKSLHEIPSGRSSQIHVHQSDEAWRLRLDGCRREEVEIDETRNEAQSSVRRLASR